MIKLGCRLRLKERVRVTLTSRTISSRPYGTFRASNFYPGLRPGLGSAVPDGTHFLIGSQAAIKALIGQSGGRRLQLLRYAFRTIGFSPTVQNGTNRQQNNLTLSQAGIFTCSRRNWKKHAHILNRFPLGNCAIGEFPNQETTVED